MHFTTLEHWLNWQNTLHPQEIELGLSRCHTVAKRLNLFPTSFHVISVAGTNGKGSSVVLLDAILSAAGYRVGRFMSPHLLRYNERICISGRERTDLELCHAFECIEKVRNEISLTFFEFSTLAALLIFKQHHIDIAVLEVGLGGRLDAVNICDPDIALITAIGIDHVDWLGSDRECIGFEKAGIFRAERPAVCSDPNPPHSIIKHARHLKVALYCLGRDFEIHTALSHLLPFQQRNAAGVLKVIDLLDLKIPKSAIQQGLKKVRLLGRFQILAGRVTCILDVAHNPLGAQVLRQSLRQLSCQGKTHAVFGMLNDKDIASVLQIMQDEISDWHIAPLNTDRSAKISALLTHFTTIPNPHITSYHSITEAYQYLIKHADVDDRIIVFGSFYTVAEVLGGDGYKP